MACPFPSIRASLLVALFAAVDLGAAPAIVPLSEVGKPLSPEEALASMRVPTGHRVELVAAEPLVMDPVAFDWGPDGRLWVAEMRDYPNGLTWNKPGEPLDAPGGRIKILTDTDGDGRYDEAALFLDGLSYPSGVKVWGKGVLVTASPEIFYAEDTDGDGKADLRETWYDGFAKSNQQHRVNGLAWGLDNWLHVANGDGGGIILSEETRDEVDIRGFDLRLDPFTKRHEPLNGRTQCGRFRDDWGNWFGCNNSNPLWHYPYPWHLLHRNPEVSLPRAYVDVPKEPGASPVYPISKTVERFNQPDRANRFTSACGPTIYRDVLLGEEISGNAFICEPVHNLVSRQVLREKGATFTSDRHPDEQTSEFFASTDPWSRPVSVRTGPDGALWIADMYRFVIEHPEWIPMEWQKKLDLRAGSELGRIYRVVPDVPESPKIPRLDGLADAALVSQLGGTNGTVRDLAHQMLLWRGARDVAPQLKEMVKSGARPTARLHALSVLDAVGLLDASTIQIALMDPDRRVVRHAVRLSPGRIADGELFRLVSPHLDDAFVVLEFAGVLDHERGDKSAPHLADLLERYQDEPHVTAVALSSVNRANLAPLLKKVHDSPELLRPLARMAAKWKDEAALAAASAKLTSGANISEAGKLALLSGLFEGGATQKSIASDKTTRDSLQGLIEGTRETVGNFALSPDKRAEAARFIGNPSVFNGKGDLGLLLDLISPQSPPSLHEAAFESLGRARHPDTASALAGRWTGLTPADRTQALSLFISRTDWTASLIAAVESETIARNEIDPATRTRLLAVKDEALRERATKLFAEATNTNRNEVLKSHLEVTSMKGDPVAGKVVFGSVCMACHAAGGAGNPVGPDLAALTDRSPDALLVAILDPNRAVEDKFVNYTVTSTGGDSIFGIVSDESANSVSIRQADGSTRTVPRNEIATMASAGVSLMPEGFEKILTKQQITDLISYLMTL